MASKWLPGRLETFSRAFRRRFARTPAEWRRNSDRAWAERSTTASVVEGDGVAASDGNPFTAWLSLLRRQHTDLDEPSLQQPRPNCVG